jgi:hypothetical protein
MSFKKAILKSHANVIVRSIKSSSRNVISLFEVAPTTISGESSIDAIKRIKDNLTEKKQIIKIRAINTPIIT